MPLIKSISGIRGIVGGVPKEGLTPQDVVSFISAYGTLIKEKNKKTALQVFVGRDARVTGKSLLDLVCSTLALTGVSVKSCGLTTTPSLASSVKNSTAVGGVMITASHNPIQWNALKFFNEEGEIVNEAFGNELLALSEKQEFSYPPYNEVGEIKEYETSIDEHINRILELPLVDASIVAKRSFKVAYDSVNSVGGPAIEKLLKALGVENVFALNGTPDGNFAHNPEPLPENLLDIQETVKRNKCDIGLVVDPDVDRLAFVCNDGSFFGEEYTIVCLADYVLQNKKGALVSNTASSRAMKGIAEKYGVSYSSSKVGELNVVEEMKKKNAVFGGEGSGGVIFPDLHYGRDALVGIALFLTYLAKRKISSKTLRETYPSYFIEKTKVTLEFEEMLPRVLEELKTSETATVSTLDGVKHSYPKEWILFRGSNTEPIIRIFAESTTKKKAKELVAKYVEMLRAKKIL